MAACKALAAPHGIPAIDPNGTAMQPPDDHERQILDALPTEPAKDSMSDSGGYDDYFRPGDSQSSAATGSGQQSLPPELSPRGRAATPSRPTSPVRRAMAWTAGILALVVLGVSGVGYAALNHYDGKINREDVFAGIAKGQDVSVSKGPVNILLVGSDGREGLTAQQRKDLSTGSFDSARSDTMMLMHIAEDNQSVTMVSFPRDSYVTIPSYVDKNGTTHPSQKNKINAAFSAGGYKKGNPSLTIRTIQDNTGLSIDHYIEVNIAGFVKMVDALNGADVCLKNAVKDKDSGLDLSAGEHHLSGAESLAYVRMRHAYADQDLGRIRAQQAFVGSVARTALSAQTLTNPIKLNRFLDAALSSVTVDKDLGQKELLGLANRMSSIKANQIQFLTVPVSNANYRVDGVGSTVKWSPSKSKALFAKLKADEPVVKPAATGSAVKVAPSAVRIQVLNAAGVTGLGAKAANDLVKVGFSMAGSAKNADTTGATVTTITYDPRYSDSLKTVQAAIPGAKVVAKEGLGKTFQVAVGSSWTGAKTVKVAGTPSSSTVKATSAADATCT